jgi:hypothetical protein
MGTVCLGKVTFKTIIIFSPFNPVKIVVSKPFICTIFGALAESTKYGILFSGKVLASNTYYLFEVLKSLADCSLYLSFLHKSETRPAFTSFHLPKKSFL